MSLSIGLFQWDTGKTGDRENRGMFLCITHKNIPRFFDYYAKVVRLVNFAVILFVTSCSFVKLPRILTSRKQTTHKHLEVREI